MSTIPKKRVCEWERITREHSSMIYFYFFYIHIPDVINIPEVLNVIVAAMVVAVAAIVIAVGYVFHMYLGF